MTDTSVSAALELNRLTRNETMTAIHAAPHGATIQIDVVHPDDRPAGWRYDVRISELSMTAGRDLITAVHDHMDAVAGTGQAPELPAGDEAGR